MKSSIFSLALVAGLAAAQAGKIPSCATSCINKYTTGDGIAGCSAIDVKCICSNADFLSGIACCLEGQCDAAGKAAAVKYAQQICSAAKVTVPDEVVCKSTSSGSASASASATGVASESASGTATGKAASSSTASAASAAVSTTASSASTETGSATDSAASSTSSTGAAGGLSSAGGLLGAIVAMLAAL
ncbi:hypothetical protein EDB80DRAFT_696060 [Ilyonectria destructans]|nr:hypothetical protein EDB80DRAFT_696060 [Ilyonectria destructans]